MCPTAVCKQTAVVCKQTANTRGEAGKETEAARRCGYLSRSEVFTRTNTFRHTEMFVSHVVPTTIKCFPPYLIPICSNMSVN